MRCPTDKWYESDLYGTLGLGFGMTTLGFTYTSYMSPGDYWHNVQELAVKLGVDDSSKLGKGALKPYGLVAFELGDGGADGVSKRVFTWSSAWLPAIPVRRRPSRSRSRSA